MAGKKLTAMAVAHAKVAAGRKVTRFWAGGGLYLEVKATGGKSWLFRYERHRQERNMFLGSATYVTLREAKDAAFEARKLLRSGVDPIKARRAGAGRARAAEVKSLTFRECAAQ